MISTYLQYLSHRERQNFRNRPGSNLGLPAEKETRPLPFPFLSQMLRQLWGRTFQQSRRLNSTFTPLSFFHSSSIRQARYVRFSQPNSPNISPGGGRGGGGKSFFNDRTWPVKIGAGVAGVGVIYYVSCLEQVPETGRYRFIAIKPETEAEIGKLALQQTLAEFKGRILPGDHPLARHVKKVVQNVLDASQLGVVRDYTQPRMMSRDDFSGDADGDGWSSSSSSSSSTSHSAHSAIVSPNKEWTVIVVNEKSIINAAATPGTVIVFTGILPVCKDEHGLAAVLSHEIGHVVARHTAERLSSQSVYIALGLFLAVLGIDFGLSAFINKMVLELPNSRLQEREADLIGLRLMSKACYNPSAAPEMFARLGQLESKIRSPEFFNTHPSSQSRVKDLEARLGEAYSILAANPMCAGVQDQVQAFRDSARMRNVFDLGRENAYGRGAEEVWR
ncbi:hypothetical protein D9757_005885 [Collybiopsis confluens]|uniref:Peptidase M48 domain-containing protein n=1 Tax=Collybiopsis confluens TaxID=2823264 RepID=A0A8H5MA68_9AGAR|nr:hypothetical protein D9757_005885 [Collybiopsis confluens]